MNELLHHSTGLGGHESRMIYCIIVVRLIGEINEEQEKFINLIL